MSDNVTFLNMDDDEDRTVFQTEEDLKKIETEIAGLTDDDTTEVEVTHQMTTPKITTTNRPYWQEVFG